MRLTARAEDAMLCAVADLLTGGSLRLYDLDPPGSPAGPVTAQQHLATLEIETVEVDAGQIRAAMSEGLSLASGRASWARCLDRNGEVIFDDFVGEDGTGAGIELNTTALKKGGPVKLRSFTWGF
jgi:hypothetical protein